MKSTLAYPNGLTASWTYGNRGELLEVNNASPTGTISRYAYTYDAAGRRVGCDKSGSAFTTPDTYAYRYNACSELTNATAVVDAAYNYGYDFDDIGNRATSSERSTNVPYAVNHLNQYTEISNSTVQPSTSNLQPLYDADGNQTLVKTATGIWQVTYNGENRPILWTHLVDESNNQINQTNQTISMSFDRMGRRVTKNDQRFVYNGYLQVANYHLSSTNYHLFVWDPTEPVATRPLVWTKNDISSYYAFDGNKNVSEVLASDGTVSAHYEYAPFGAVTVSRGTSAATNPFRFSSEYAEDDTATVYYNYRHYEPVTGRWMRRDPAGEFGGMDVYAFCENKISVDINGLAGICDDLGAMCNEVWPPPPGGWGAYAEAQRIERERQATENALPNFSLVVGVSGSRNFPVGGGWGIAITTDISWEFGTCCDKENNTKNFRKLIGKISAGPYVGVASLIVLPELKPLEVPVGYIGECPEPGETYDGFLSFQFKAGGPYVGCSYSFKDKKWSCGAGFTIEKITNIKLAVEGGVSYEVVTIY